MRAFQVECYQRARAHLGVPVKTGFLSRPPRHTGAQKCDPAVFSNTWFGIYGLSQHVHRLSAFMVDQEAILLVSYTTSKL